MSKVVKKDNLPSSLRLNYRLNKQI